MKQETGKGVVILDKSKFMENCLVMLNTEKFRKINSNTSPPLPIPTPTSRKKNKIERKIQINP